MERKNINIFIYKSLNFVSIFKHQLIDVMWKTKHGLHVYIRMQYYLLHIYVSDRNEIWHQRNAFGKEVGWLLDARSRRSFARVSRCVRRGFAVASHRCNRRSWSGIVEEKRIFHLHFAGLKAHE